MDEFGFKEYTLAFYLWFYTFYSALTYGFFYSKRKKYEYNKKSFSLITLIVISNYLMTSMICVREIITPDKFPCAVYIIFSYVVPPTFVICYFIRGVDLYKKYEILYEDSLPLPKHYFRWLFFMIIMINFFISFYNIIFIYGVGIFANVGCRFQKEFDFFLSFLALYIILGIIIIWKLQKCKDALFVRKEILIVFSMMILIGIPFLIINAITTLFKQANSIAPVSLLLVIMAFISHTITIINPIIHFSKMKNVRTIITPLKAIYHRRDETLYDISGKNYIEPHTILSIDEILKNTFLLSYFKSFLQSRGKEYLLNFWLDSTDYSIIVNDAKLANKASYIYAKYFKRKGISYIGVTEVTRSEIENAVKRLLLKPNTFENSNKLVYTTLSIQEFPLFLASTEYYKLRGDFTKKNENDMIPSARISEDDETVTLIIHKENNELL